jgi:hypothetical protein
VSFQKRYRAKFSRSKKPSGPIKLDDLIERRRIDNMVTRMIAPACRNPHSGDWVNWQIIADQCRRLDAAFLMKQMNQKSTNSSRSSGS